MVSIPRVIVMNMNTFFIWVVLQKTIKMKKGCRKFVLFFKIILGVK